MPLRVLHADDHAMFREGILFFLRLIDESVVVTTASTYQSTLDQLAIGGPVDLLLLDLSMPGMAGLEGFFAIRQAHPDLTIAVLSGANDARTVQVVLDGGARGFIPKLASSEELLSALRRIVDGKTYAPEAMLSSRASSHHLGCGSVDLTDRQIEILTLLADGMPNKMIARALGITEGTVKQHLKLLFRRLGVKNRVQAVQAARRLELLD
ncbi:response regulator transcription factor [Ruegeria sp. Ofav3-42]|uniref:response regulator n=1 Tax=Ruegeria sp. Ofav3-42 TaxID=2917759 RepID=UPI001EF4AE94|nr:response regulator transcription factor [Ruegeria sp. Ofav3-42]MCG7521679.1 response regulator transcription factor [Ruegeria sp. Ofav3-42]